MTATSQYQGGLSSLAQRQQAIAAQQAAFMNRGSTTAASPSALTTSNNTFYITSCSSTTSSTASSAMITIGTGTNLGVVSYPPGPGRMIDLDDGRPHTVNLPDGTIIDVKADGSFEIKDQDAKVVYRASRVREFNTFINASDRLEEFIAFCGEQAIRKDEMLELPLKLFIGWLVLQAAKADKEPEPEVKLLPDLRRLIKPRCGSCQRFLPRRYKPAGIDFCATACFERKRLSILQPRLPMRGELA